MDRDNHMTTLAANIHRRTTWTILTLFFTLFLIACDGISGNTAEATPTPVPVNGFGTADNHVHTLLALPNNVLVLATHYGTYRSENGGTTWQQVSGGSNQPMQGLMDYSLVVSTLDPQRLYVLTRPAVNPHAGTLGLYSSKDQGHTWKLATPTASLATNDIFFVAPGNDTPDECYIYISDLGALGLKVSLDNGQHFSNTGGTLPFGRILGMLAIPGMPGHLLVYGSDGMARSTDGGLHWQVMSGITGGIYNMTTSGAHGLIYASGDAGIYVSKDGGTTFKLVNKQASYGSLTIPPTQSQVIYGKTATTIYRSTDGGLTWKALPPIKGNLWSVVVDPANPSKVYLSISYPVQVYHFEQGEIAWSSLTPKV